MNTKKQGWWLCPNRVSHLCPEKYHVSACGISKAKIMALDISSVTCKRCMRTKAWKAYMWKDKG